MRYFSFFLLSGALFGCQFEQGISAFNLTGIASSQEATQRDRLLFSWDGETQERRYSICIKDETKENDCYSLADVTGVNEAVVKLDSFIEQYDKDYFILARDPISIGKSNEMRIPLEALDSLIDHVKASNSKSGNKFGYSVVLSGDGNTLAVGAINESSDPKGGEDTSSHHLFSSSGAVYVYRFNGLFWQEEAFIKSSNSGANDHFGASVSLSSDGNTLVVGAKGESSNATGVNDTAINNDLAAQSGAAYVYHFNKESGWKETAFMKASNAQIDDRFGTSLSLNAQGDVLLVGAPGEDSDLMGVHPEFEQMNENSIDSGAAYLFRLNEGRWTQEAYIKASNTDTQDTFGERVSLSADGKSVAVGALGESSDGKGIDSNNLNNAAPKSGAVYVYRNDGLAWSFQSYLKAFNSKRDALFGSALAFSSNGNRLVVGSVGESSNATGENGNPFNTEASASGAVYVFDYKDTAWQQEAYLKASNTALNDKFGSDVSLTADGHSLLVGARGESSGAGLIGGDELDNSQKNAGAMYVFKFNGNHWEQHAYVKSKNPQDSDLFGAAVTQSSNGKVVAIGASGDASAANGINAADFERSALNSGAVFIY